jgi:hypothetical protein
MRMRFLMLRDIARLSSSMSTLILNGTLCLSVRSCALLRDCLGRGLGLFKEHRMKISFSPEVGETKKVIWELREVQ